LNGRKFFFTALIVFPFVDAYETRLVFAGLLNFFVLKNLLKVLGTSIPQKFV